MENENEKECVAPRTWACPICGVPLSVGEKCEDGTLIERVPLPEVPKYLHDFNADMFTLELLDVAPSWGEIDEQYAIFMVIPPLPPQQKAAQIGHLAPQGIDKEKIDWALYNLIMEYKYCKDSGLIEKLKERYGEEIKTYHQTTTRITPGQRSWIVRAAGEWGVTIQDLVALFIAYVLNDERFQPGWD